MTPAAAKSAFLAIAGRKLKDDTNLDALLETLDGHPLSISLLAARASGLSQLGDLYKAFVKNRASLSRRRDPSEESLTSTRASLSFSLKSKQLSAEAKRLLSLIACLSDGMSPQLSAEFVGDSADSARVTLIRLGLASDQGNGRLNILAPLREAIRLDSPASQADEDKLIDYMLALAELGSTVGTREWTEKGPLVKAEANNFDPIISWAISRGRPWSDINKPLLGMVELHRLAGLGSVNAIDAAMQKYGGDDEVRARLEIRRASIALDRFDHEAATKSFTIARDLFRKVGLRFGEALSIKGLAQIAKRKSDHQTAEQNYTAAKDLLHLDNQVEAEADCVVALANIALERVQFQAARTGYDQALKMYRSKENEIGEASCLLSLAHWALRLSDLQLANQNFVDADRLYKKIGHAHGETNCAQGLGLIASQEARFEDAQRLLEETVQQYWTFSDMGGVATSQQALGLIAQMQGKPAIAASYFAQALQLYRQNGQKLGEANCIEAQADLALMAQDIAQARSLYAEALQRYPARGSGSSEASVYWQLGEIEKVDNPAESLRLREKSMVIRRSIPQDLALPGWEALFAHVNATSQAEADRQRMLAGARWEKIGRKDWRLPILSRVMSDARA